MTLNESTNNFFISRGILDFDANVILSTSIKIRDQIRNNVIIIIHNRAELLYTIQR
jgi:hypothetical protein